MKFDKPITRDNVRNELKTVYEKGQGDAIFLGEERIGRLVRFGKATGMSRKTVKTVYASRIYGHGFGTIEAEGSSPRSVLDKVAAEVTRKLKAAAKEAKSEAEVPTEEIEDGPKMSM